MYYIPILTSMFNIEKYKWICDKEKEKQWIEQLGIDREHRDLAERAWNRRV